MRQGLKMNQSSQFIGQTIYKFTEYMSSVYAAEKWRFSSASGTVVSCKTVEKWHNIFVQ